MTSREATIYQLKKLKGQPLKKQISYIVSNFWVPIVAIIAAVATLVSLIVHWSNQKPTALALCCVNSPAEETDVLSYLYGFAEEHGIDTEEYELETELLFLLNETNSNYESVQMLAAMLMAGSVDVMSADTATMVRYAYQHAFLYLDELLTQEQKDALAPYFLYIDMSRLEELSAPHEGVPPFPDPTKPEEMGQPVPFAIILQPEWDFAEVCYPYTYGDDAVGLVASTKNAENAQAFLQYILSQEEN